MTQEPFHPKDVDYAVILHGGDPLFCKTHRFPIIDEKGVRIMKKFIAIILTLALVLSMSACGAAEKSDSAAYKVAIVQQLDHSSLDEIRTAINAELTRLAAEKGITVEIKEYNGQNDTTMLNQISTDAVADKVDMIIPIATLAAVSAVTATEGTDIPVVYAAISDPESAGLTGIPYVTGVSDALNTPFILDMMLACQPDIQCVGLLYSNSEPNSLGPIAEAKAYLDAKGIAYEEKTGTSPNEIITAANALVGRCQAVFTPTDNVVMSAEGAVAEIFASNGIAHYAGADSFVTSGAFATCGVNYTELGQKAGQMAFEILLGAPVPGDYHVMEGGIITVNTETAAALAMDYAPFSQMANTVLEVTTAAE